MRNAEQNEILGTFNDLLAGPTGDGGNKRARGEKPSWKVDMTHLRKGIGHLVRYLCGERVDKDSGCHPLQHAAWRFLAVAFQDLAADGKVPENPADTRVTPSSVDGRCRAHRPQPFEGIVSAPGQMTVDDGLAAAKHGNPIADAIEDVRGPR